ncbi:MAG: rRNA adenine N-6-methyltransferase family protein, partial [Candidatus Pacebacteria bacterium]|nr:rRNA adenine N-6-methyltransferase family protein [Candidatus Paceibacterota bacterium]
MIRHVRYGRVSPEAAEIYAHFSAQEGSEYIATPVTIQAILDQNTKTPLSRVLEMGAGIGTLTYTVAKYTKAHIDTYEDNAFCIAALTKHLAGLESSYTLMTDYAVTPPVRTYDLVLIDGGGGKGE